MNYRHAFHAGNFADVLKHAVLVRILLHLCRKEAPFRVLDTHAGIGVYDLAGSEAERTGEWRAGIGRLLGTTLRGPTEEILAPYRGLIQQMRAEMGPSVYPGSPEIARRLARPGDRLLLVERHPQDARRLAEAMGRDRRVKVLEQDAWVALRAHLPPREKRGLVLVDPPFEEPDEFEHMIEGLRQAIRRWEGGTYALWYPIKDPAGPEAFVAAVRDLGLPKLLRIEMTVRRPADPRLLNGSGLLVVNPPWTLQDEARALLDGLVPLLAQGPGAAGRAVAVDMA